MLKHVNILFLGVFLLLFASCIKTRDISPIPAIEFKDFIKSSNLDSAQLIIGFKDGDGNIGLKQSDTTGIYSKNNFYHYNIYMRYFYKKADGTFEQFVLPSGDTLEYKYRIPDITPEGQDKTLDGEMEITLFSPYYYPGHTVVRFDVFIIDQEQNKSNVISTPEINVP